MSVSSAREAERQAHLEIANRIRTARGEFKRKLRNGDLTVAQVLRDPEGWPVKTLPVYELLMMGPYWGLARTSKLLRQVDVWPLRPVGRLTDAQRKRLVFRLEWPL